MKRPFAVLGLTYLTALAAALLIGYRLGYALSLILTVLFVFSLLIKRLRRKAAVPLVLITAAAAVLSFSLFTELRVEPAEALADTEQRITATLCDEVYESNGKYYYPLEVTKIRNSELSGFKLIASSEVLYDVDVYDELDAKLKLYQSSDSIFKNYDIARGYFLRGYIEHYSGVMTEKSYVKPFYYNFILLKRSVKEIISEYLPQDCAKLLTAVMLGDKHSFSSEEKEGFSSAGISHLMSVSGFHVTIVAQLFMLLFSAIFRRKRVGAVPSIAALLVFMAVVGFSPTVLRAGIMQIIFLVGIACFKSPDSLNSLGFSVLVICLLSPYSCADFSFLMSAGATLGIFCCSESIKAHILEMLRQRKARRIGKLYLNRIIPEKKAEKLLSFIASSIALTVSATVFTLPITLMVFKQLPLYSVLANLLISYPASIMITCGIIAVLLKLSVLLSLLTAPLMLVCRLIAEYIMFWTRAISALPFSSVKLNYSFVPIWITAVLVLYVVLRMLKSRRFAVKLTAASGTAALALMIIAYNIYMAIGTTVYIADCGDGITLVVSSDGDNSFISYGGNKAYDLFDCLETNGVSELKYALSASCDSYYAKNINELLSDYSVRSLGLYGSEKADEDFMLLAQDVDKITEYEANTLNTEVFSDFSVTSVKCESGVFTHIDLGNDFDMLIVPNGGDCSEMPAEWLNSAVCVLSELPENAELLRPAELVLSCSDENVYELYNCLESVCDTIYATCFDDNIRMRASQSGAVSTWSEDNWLS